MAAAGDIAIVGFGSDTGNKRVSFVLLSADLAGQTITVTDNGWKAAGGFRTGEGTLNFTIPVDAAVGTVFTLPGSGDFTTVNPSTAGDQLLFYTGAAASPTFLAAVNFAGDAATTSWAADATNSNTSAVPAGLSATSTAGAPATALAFGPDNGAYAGPTTGTRADILAAIADPSHWTLNDTAEPAVVSGFTVTGAGTGGGAPASFSVAAASGTEGGNVDFTVTRAGDATAAADVTWTVAAGTATAPDFAGGALPTGAVHFDAGATTAVIHVATTDDATYEGTEAFSLSLTSASAGTVAANGATATGTLVDNDPAPAYGALSVADASAVEGNAGTTLLHFTVTRDNGSDGAVSADWSVAAGTADASDFVGGALPTGTVSFAAGQTTATIDVAVQGDTGFEADESFTVSLATPVGGATLADGTAIGTIVNDDAAAPTTLRLFAESFTGFTAAGFAPTPAAGQLDSDIWRVVGLSDNPTPAYGFTATTGDFARGTIAANDPATAGVYSPASNGALIVQPTTAELESGGFIEGRIQNTSGQTATSFDVGFDWAYRNSGARADQLQLSYSTDGVTFTAVPAAAFTTPGVADAAITGTFADQHETVTLSGLAVPTGDYLTLRWTHVASTGSGNRDEVGIDNVTVDATVTDQPIVTVSAPTIAEGNAGSTDAVFTFTRSSGAGAASVDYVTSDGTAHAGSDYTATQGTVSFADGQTVATVHVAVTGDIQFEPDETFALDLSNPVGLLVPQTHITGTIQNDDQNIVRIFDIQGAGHTSAYVGLNVTTTGIVTAVDDTGFYLQDATGDGDAATSDGVFVFTHTRPAVTVGDAATVAGAVAEYSADPGVGLTTTEVDVATAAGITVTGHVDTLPAAVVIGVDGVLPPTQAIDDDGLKSFDPRADGIDFYESLEGMRVTVETPTVIERTNSFGESYVVASHGVGATNVSASGGLVLAGDDFNPERIKIDHDAGIYASDGAKYVEGDQLSSVTGVMSYGFDEYVVHATQPIAVTQASTLAPETTALHGDADHLSVATYNVENLDPSDMKYDILAQDIVYNLGGPDVISLQEVQDDNGATNDGTVSAAQNLTNLLDAINSLDPASHYVYAEIDPANNSTGGEPGGNIRNAFLYDSNRVLLVAGSLTQITGAEFAGSRNPLVGTFSFNGQNVTLVDVHSYSRGGSDPDWGAVQPAQAHGDDRRTAMADGVRGYIDDALATDPNHQFAVMGDFNGFYYEDAFKHLTAGGTLTNLSVALLPPQERYSYEYDGSLQEFDYILTTPGVTRDAQYDSVHLNAQFGQAVTDHDPQVALLSIPHSTGGATLVGTAGDDSLVGTASDDIIAGGLGNDRIDGGDGYNTAVFHNNLGDVTSITHTAPYAVTVTGPEGTDTLFNIDALRFADGTINLVNANPLVDNLFYDQHNPDVYAAGIDPTAHFLAFGEAEGRDPNAFFSTTGYLAANPDLGTGTNLLQEFDQQGWRQGRDPSAGFDTRLYLLHNPDVAQAGMDPLAHYLQFGQYEGRATYAAIGDTISANGFDAEYYLLANPDVAAAGIDPYQHYLQYGAAEGRNPNAWFDTKGYLAANPDVAAAGINPLVHYDTYGWQEGRDPSAAFDTKAYLAANPDVVAAHVDPLVHFLQYGAYELRDPHSDGMIATASHVTP